MVHIHCVNVRLLRAHFSVPFAISAKPWTVSWKNAFIEIKPLIRFRVRIPQSNRDKSLLECGLPCRAEFVILLPDMREVSRWRAGREVRRRKRGREAERKGGDGII